MGQFDSTVVISTDYSILGANSESDNLTIGTSAVEVKTTLSERTSVFIQADVNNADIIYLANDNLVSNTHFFAMLSPGQSIQLILSTSSIMQIFAKGTVSGEKISILDGVN